MEESISICEQRLRNDDTLGNRTAMNVSTIISLLRFCLTTTSFQYDNQHYKQLDCVAMGSPVSPVVANLFMEEFEEKALSVQTSGPRMWKRFVDDVIAVIKKERSKLFLEYPNQQHEKIKFTMEEERGGSVPLMDVRFKQNARGELNLEVYQKATHTNRYIHFRSHHPDSVKSGVIECLMKRAVTVSSDTDMLRKETNHIMQAMSNNRYPRTFVKKAIQRVNVLCDITHDYIINHMNTFNYS